MRNTVREASHNFINNSISPELTQKPYSPSDSGYVFEIFDSRASPSTKYSTQNLRSCSKYQSSRSPLQRSKLGRGSKSKLRSLSCESSTDNSYRRYKLQNLILILHWEMIASDFCGVYIDIVTRVHKCTTREPILAVLYCPGPRTGLGTIIYSIV